MATVINITNKIKNEEKFLVVGENKYRVDDRKNTVTEVMALFDDASKGDFERMDEALRLLIGGEAFAEVEEMNLPLTDYQAIFIGAMACVNGKTYEETEATFRG
ncbi:MAG: hypothetical protein KBS74_03695 [Clostridiales bacterium]|nr:hypothetical protein [Candidatus Cacconaster stercorequi]